jgi:hypothetical protein
MFKIGVIGTSKKQNERRVPIHPDHLRRLPEDVRRQLVFEEGYGIPFNIEDLVLLPLRRCSSGVLVEILGVILFTKIMNWPGIVRSCTH